MSESIQPAAMPSVGLFVTCVVDLARPRVGFAAVRLLERAGCRVEVPLPQTCCGQPAYNSGDANDARALARQVIEAFEGFDYLVAPSGSCAGMIREHYPRLFATDVAWAARARALAARTHELMSFLTDVMDYRAVEARLAARATYHDSCSGLRELGIREQPRRLLAAVEGLTLAEMEDAGTCCGFGGSFSVKFPGLSGRMVTDKAERITATGAEVVLGGDLSCLLNIAGRLHREGSPARVYHAAEVLADMAEGAPAIGEPAATGKR